MDSTQEITPKGNAAPAAPARRGRKRLIPKENKETVRKRLFKEPGDIDAHDVLVIDDSRYVKVYIFI